MAKAFNLGEELRKAGGPTVDTREQIEYLDPDLIIPDPKNDYSMDGIEELAASIELVGLQQPLRVHDVEGGNYMLISGHRRREALMLLRNSGNEMFKHGFPCIRERPADIPEMQELKLIFGNAQTRVMSAPELSRQAVKTRDLIARLRDRGYNFQGRTRELVASVLQTSDSRVGRLTAIREKLVPELLTQFDKGFIGETAAYRLSQETREMQSDIWRHCGISVQGLSVESVGFVIDQIKRSRQAAAQAPEQPKSEPGKNKTSVGEGLAPPKKPEAVKSLESGRASPAPTGMTGAEHNAIDGLKKYLDARHDEDTRFWKYMQEAADDLILHSFASGALPIRKDNIDMLRLDCRNASVAGYAADWEGSNKGITLQSLSRTKAIFRTWTDAYDALAAIAITRWRQVLVDGQNRRGRQQAADVPTVCTGLPQSAAPTAPSEREPEWQTGTPPKPGGYVCWCKYIGLPDYTYDDDYEVLFWSGEVWGEYVGHDDSEDYEVHAWYPLLAPPEKE